MHKQPQLNGAYYGPPIPPPKPYHRSSSGGRGCCARCGCCLFDCIFDCGCCLLGCVFKILCSFLLAAAAVLLLLWFFLRPHEVQFHASDASLSAFNLSSADNQLSYNLALNLTVRNPSGHVGVYYDSFEANAIFQGQRFAMAEVAPFFQKSKNTTEIGPLVFKGRTTLPLGSGQSFDYQSQRNNGEFEIAVKLYLKVRFKLGWFKTGKFRPRFRCDLTLPLSASSSTSKFKPTKCYFDP